VAPKNDIPKFYISWTTVTYRSVLGAILLVAAIATGASYFTFPEPTKRAVNNSLNYLLQLTDRLAPGKTSSKPPAGQQQASFTMLEGTVRVKKANSNSWVNADYTLPLEKGDVVQTGSEGIAKVVFPDGTNYSLKQDSLMVVQENSSNEEQQTQVAVQLNTGTVDLTTGTYTQGSKSQVIVGGATASFAQDSSALVRNDPHSDQHQILVKRGSGEVTRGVESVKLAGYESVSFKSESPKLEKQKEIAPPTLIAPANMMPIFLSDQQDSIQFYWSPVVNTAEYHIRVSRNPFFSSTLFDRRVNEPKVTLPNPGEGAYYWTVQAVDAAGKESVDSEKNRFTIIRKGPENVSLALEIAPFVQHGHVLELRGKTEPHARIMVNGQEVPVIQSDGSFQFFTPPLPNGENTITITAQNAKGGVRTMQKKVVIQ